MFCLVKKADVAQLVELQFSKLVVAGSIPVIRSKRWLEKAKKGKYNPSLAGLRPAYAEVAQLVEHLLAKEKVASSSLVFRSNGRLSELVR
jgi:hypothetical protein